MFTSRRGWIFAALVIVGSCLVSGCGGGTLSNLNSSSSSSTTSGQISGQVVDSFSKAPLPGTFIALELRDSQNIERPLRVTYTDANGKFAFQSVPTGTYEVAAYSPNNFNPFYTWMVIFSVPQQADLGAVPLQGTIQAPEGFPGTATGTVTSSPVAVESTIWLMSPVTRNGTNLLVTIPFTANGFVSKTNGAASAVAYGVKTETFLPLIGVFSGNSVSYQANSGSGNMVIDAQAFQSSLPTTPDCVPPELQTAPFTITIGPGMVTGVPTLA